MTDALKVVALTGGRHVPGARFRVGQYVEPLRRLDVDLRWIPAPIPKHPPRVRPLRPFWFPLSVLGRVPGVVASRRADITLVTRELVSTFITLEPCLKRPLVVDVDDAIWLHRGGGFARRLGGLATAVVAGNSFVADWFSRHCSDVHIVPTAVDTDRFRPGSGENAHPPTIGWSGTSTNLPFLESLQPALRRVMSERRDVVLKVSSDHEPRLRDLPADRVVFERWSAGTEVAFLRSLDIGLMPLADDEWSRGKCSYKMLLYLACATPAVVTPVGMNAEVLAAADVGRGADSEAAWVAALLDLLDDADARRAMGARGRDLVERNYSVDVLAPRLASIFKAFDGRSA